MSSAGGSDHLTWNTVAVHGRRVEYGVAGEGLPVLFVHGWALASRAYKRSLKRLVRLGCRVYAPALPGFGRTSPIDGGRCDMQALAAWAAELLDALGIDEPVLAVGHSLGGAVVTRLAHDFPDRVASLVLVNTAGGAVWSGSGQAARGMAERPAWQWATSFPRDILSEPDRFRLLRALLGDAVPNVLGNPVGLLRAGLAARSIDITAELGALCAAGLPVLVIWGEGDSILPVAGFHAICAGSGARGLLVEGRHSWLVSDPDSFGAAMAEVVREARAGRARRARGGTAVGAPATVEVAPDLGRAANE